MTTWVDTKRPTTWKWVGVIAAFGVATAIAFAPAYLGLASLHGWSLWACCLGVVITLVAFFVFQTFVVLALLVMASFAFCVNVNNGHILPWAFAWLATAIGALFANSFLRDMSWLYHWSKARDTSADN